MFLKKMKNAFSEIPYILADKSLVVALRSRGGLLDAPHPRISKNILQPEDSEAFKSFQMIKKNKEFNVFLVDLKVLGRGTKEQDRARSGQPKNHNFVSRHWEVTAFQHFLLDELWNWSQKRWPDWLEMSDLISKLAHLETVAVNWKYIFLQCISLTNAWQIALPFLKRKII